MPEQKSKLPDISELTSMATKLLKDVQKSISQIIEEYKSKHVSSEPNAEEKPESPKASVPPVQSKTTETQDQTISTDKVVHSKTSKTQESITKDE